MYEDVFDKTDQKRLRRIQTYYDLSGLLKGLMNAFNDKEMIRVKAPHSPDIFEYKKSLLLRDLYALNLIAPLVTDYPYLPFSASSIRPYCLSHILNDIVINRRRTIIEFGAGISTMLIGRLIKRNKMNVSLVSIDHDKKWIDNVRVSLKNEQIDGVKLVYAPLAKSSITGNGDEWYDYKMVSDVVRGKQFDMVIIDGPPAWEESKQLARYPAVPFILGSLCEDSVIYLDDADRSGEQMILKMWEEQYKVEFNKSGDTFAFVYFGRAFNTEPCK